MIYANRFLNRHGPGWLLVAAVLGLLVAAIQPAQAQWTETVLYSFGWQPDGAKPHAGLIRDAVGNLYGTTVYGGQGAGTVFELTYPSWTETVLHSFTGAPTDGAYAWGGLVRDAKGHLYGTTNGGGAKISYGTVFEIVPPETLLYSFGGGDGTDPVASLIRDGKGNLYGTTYEGGAYTYGTVFELVKTGSTTYTEIVLYSFTGGADGSGPWAGLIRDGKGNLYGTTVSGGTYGYGTVFELVKTGSTTYTEIVLYSFTGGADGSGPWAGLIRDGKGNLYGTTLYGGAYTYYGTVFELVKTGSTTYTEIVLHSFTGGTDGGYPWAGLVRDAKGNLYGTTYAGGTHGVGTVFELTRSGSMWTEAVLHSFAYSPDGAGPTAGLIRDVAGNLYGTTANGGNPYCDLGCGTVFELTP